MDPAAFFSVEELAVWSDQREMFQLLHFTSLGIRLAFLITVAFTGIHLAIRAWAEAMARCLYRRPLLIRLGNAATSLRGVIRVFEKLSAGKDGALEKHQWLVDAFYPMILTLLWMLLGLPMNFFGSYILGHELQKSNITLGLWWTDLAKSMLLTLIYSGFLGLGLFGLARRLRRTWWLWLWGAVVGGLVLWSLLSPYRARIFHDFQKLPDNSLQSSIQTIMDKAGLKTEAVEVVDTSKRSKGANAFIMGEGPTRRVVLSDNLVREFHPREVMAAVAHEAGHCLHEHPTRTWLVTSVAALLFLALVRLLLWGAPRIRRFGLHPHADPAILPLILLVLKLVFLANDPFSGWLSRSEERLADSEALRLTQDPVAYCSLLIRLNRLNQADPDPPAWVVWYFKHHPSTAERLRHGMRWAQTHNIRMGPDALPLPAPGPPK